MRIPKLRTGSFFPSLLERRRRVDLRRDPGASVSVFAADDPYRTADIRVTVELVDDPDRRLSVELTQRYLGQDPPPDPRARIG